MSRLHSTLVALVLGAAAAAGLFAAVHTVRLGQKVSAPKPAAPEIASRQAKLARWSRSLREARAKHPPTLPKLPRFAPVQTAATPVAAPAPQVTYVRPQPVVKYQRASRSTQTTTTTATRSSWSDDGGRSDDGTGGGDGSVGGGD
jgi:hypothetical protein